MTLYNEALKSLLSKDKENNNEALFKQLVESEAITVGIDHELCKQHAKLRDEVKEMVDNRAMYAFCNNKGKPSNRGPTASGPPGSEYLKNLKVLEDHAPTLHTYVQRMSEAYQKDDQVLCGLWWTYYRPDISKVEAMWVKLGNMLPHRDQLSGASTRVITTLFKNQVEGKQKRMSFHSKKLSRKAKKSEKTWIDIHHGMYVCLTEEGSGYVEFEKGKYIYHGVENAEGTWTLTMEFMKDKKNKTKKKST